MGGQQQQPRGLLLLLDDCCAGLLAGQETSAGYLGNGSTLFSGAG